MRNLRNKILVVLLALGALCACQERIDKPQQSYIDVNYVSIGGQWTLSSWNGDAFGQDNGLYVHIDFDRKEHTFVMRDNIDSMHGHTVTGTYTLEKNEDGDDILSGVYDYSGQSFGDYVVRNMTAESMELHSDKGIYTFIRVIEN